LANLQGAFLNSTQLQGASFYGASLQGARLNDSDLRGASLVDAALQGASLDNVDLRGGFLNAAELQGAPLRNADIEGASVNGVQFQGGLFENTNLDYSMASYLWVWRATGASCKNARITDYNADALIEVIFIYDKGDRPVVATQETIEKFIESSVAD